MFRIKKLIVSVIYLFLSLFIKRRDNYVAIGNWKGQLYNDNSRYFAEYIRDNKKDIRIFWVGNKEIEKTVKKNINNVIFVRKDSIISSLKLLKCKYMFFSQFHQADISHFNVYRGAITCYLHHGFCIKKWNDDGFNEQINTRKRFSKFLSAICGNYVKYDYFAISSSLHNKAFCSSLKSKGYTVEKGIQSGTPRNDMFFNVDRSKITNLKRIYSRKIGFDSKDKVIAYLPTYRRTDTYIFSFTTLSGKRRKMVDEVLREHNCVLIEKSHFAENKKCDTSEKGDRIIGCSGDLNVQELLLCADVLISDYSGALMDYLFLDRPIIYYVYDYEYYKNADSGLYYEIEDYSAGPIAYNFNELVRCMESTLSGVDEYAKKRMYIRDKYMSYECGKASEIIYNSVIENEK